LAQKIGHHLPYLKVQEFGVWHAGGVADVPMRCG